MGTLAEQLIQRGIQKGRAEGIQAGQRETLARLLTLKFGPLPSAAAQCLDSANADELARYTLRVLAADTLDAVFE